MTDTTVTPDPDNPGTYWIDSAPAQVNTDDCHRAYLTGNLSEVMSAAEIRRLGHACLDMAEFLETGAGGPLDLQVVRFLDRARAAMPNFISDLADSVDTKEIEALCGNGMALLDEMGQHSTTLSRVYDALSREYNSVALGIEGSGKRAEIEDWLNLLDVINEALTDGQTLLNLDKEGN